MKSNNKMSITVVQIALMASTFLTSPSETEAQSGGDSRSNGGGNPRLAYSHDQLQRMVNQPNFDFLKMTKTDVDARDERIQKALGNYYTSANLGRMIQLLRSEYGLMIYEQHRRVFKDPSDKDDPFNSEDRVSDFRTTLGIMQNAVQYYLGTDNKFSGTADGEIGSRGILDTLKHKRGHVSTVVNVGEQRELCDWYWYKLNSSSTRYSLNAMISLVFTMDTSCPVNGSIRNEKHSTASLALSKVPSVDDFYNALKILRLKALDAMVVFLSGEIIDPRTKRHTYVIFPQNSNRVPFPKPVILVGKNARMSDITAVLRDNVGKIFAYNMLFESKVLPKIQDLTLALEKYPDLQLEAPSKEFDQARVQQPVFEAYLKVTSAILASKSSDGAQVAPSSLDLENTLDNPNFREVLQTQTRPLLLPKNN